MDSATEVQDKDLVDVVVEISGAVEKPGVYKLREGSRIEDLLISAGGLSAEADRNYIDKNINKAAKLVDGQKVFILKVDSSNKDLNNQSSAASANNLGENSGVSDSWGSGTTEKVNINTASSTELDTLYGIGPVYAQNIIEHRPYSNIEELVSKGVIKQNTFNKIKDQISVY